MSGGNVLDPDIDIYRQVNSVEIETNEEFL